MQRVITYCLSDNLVEKLLELVSNYYLSMEDDISRLAFVFGGKRPGLFLKKAISERMRCGYFPPAFFPWKNMLTIRFPAWKVRGA